MCETGAVRQSLVPMDTQGAETWGMRMDERRTLDIKEMKSSRSI